MGCCRRRKLREGVRLAPPVTAETQTQAEDGVLASREPTDEREEEYRASSEDNPNGALSYVPGNIRFPIALTGIQPTRTHDQFRRARALRASHLIRGRHSRAAGLLPRQGPREL